MARARACATSSRCCMARRVALRRGALAAINSVIANAHCPDRLLFHVPSLDATNRARLATSMQDSFGNVHVYHFSQVGPPPPTCGAPAQGSCSFFCHHLVPTCSALLCLPLSSSPRAVAPCLSVLTALLRPAILAAAKACLPAVEQGVGCSSKGHCQQIRNEAEAYVQHSAFLRLLFLRLLRCEFLCLPVVRLFALFGAPSRAACRNAAGARADA
jgi:hypothetical protein